jgi:aldo/keto reductase family protein
MYHSDSAEDPERRADIFLATKFGITRTVENMKVSMSINSTPENCRERCEASLKRLKTDYIDLYYIHRTDNKTPIEKTMEELVKLKKCVSAPSFIPTFIPTFISAVNPSRHPRLYDDIADQCQKRGQSPPLRTLRRIIQHPPPRLCRLPCRRHAG